MYNKYKYKFEFEEDKAFCKKVLIGLCLLSCIPFTFYDANHPITVITVIVYTLGFTLIGFIFCALTFSWLKNLSQKHSLISSVLFFTLIILAFRIYDYKDRMNEIIFEENPKSVLVALAITNHQIIYGYKKSIDFIAKEIITKNNVNTKKEFQFRIENFSTALEFLVFYTFLPTMFIFFGLYSIYNLMKSFVNKTFKDDLKESFLRIIFKK